MSGDPGAIVLASGGTRIPVALSAFVDAGVREWAAREANAWIKRLRLARVDGHSLRDRFRYRGDSLWWFTELYLHKEARVVRWLEILRAAERCLDTYAPTALEIPVGSTDEAAIVAAVARARHVPVTTRAGSGQGAWSAAADRAARASRARFYTWSAHLSHRRRGNDAALEPQGGVVAFVHSAFWRARRAGSREPGAGADGEEGYIGPVLEALGQERPPGGLTLVGVGPQVNFRARAWWHGARRPRDDQRLPFRPVESFADRAAIAPSLEVWRERRDNARALLASPDVREASRLAGYDLWPLVMRELTGVVHLQWPWSARSMDEAGAVLDRLAPSAILTYAEAGGWGRAIMLEARRRSIGSVGLQHGFIYRHWLNYLHEPDEMVPSPSNAGDRGFPIPDLTLLFDRYAEQHLISAGHFPPASLRVTGSVRLDALVTAAGRMDDAARAAVRHAVGAAPRETILLMAAKYTQVRHVFRRVAEAAAGLPDVRLVIKCHPAETPGPYERAADGLPRVVVAPPDADLAGLLAVSCGLVTVNSTVALDALSFGVPSLVVDLPNNLTPFVEAGVMLGASAEADLVPLLAALLTEGAARSRLIMEGRRFLERHGIVADGGAARRAAESVRSVKARACSL